MKTGYAIEFWEGTVSDTMSLDELIEILRVLEKPSMRELLRDATITIISAED